jgi:hypothetical protein
MFNHLTGQVSCQSPGNRPAQARVANDDATDRPAGDVRRDAAPRGLDFG